jgi:MFS family permease
MGIGAGIYGVAVVAFSADLTRGRSVFKTLMGLFATALAIGGVIGPLLSGFWWNASAFARRFTSSPRSQQWAPWFSRGLYRKSPVNRVPRSPPH